MNLFLSLAWTLLSFAGLALALVGVRDGYRDSAYLHQSGLNGLRLRVARRNIRMSMARALAFTIGLALGLFVLFGPERIGWQRHVVPVGLVLTLGLLVIDALKDHLTRRDLYREWQKQRAAAELEEQLRGSE